MKIHNIHYLLAKVLCGLWALSVPATAWGGAPLPPAPAQEPPPPSSPFDFDILGNHHYSRNNFTDLVNPYDGIDGYTLLRFSYWPLDGQNQRENFGAYAELLHSYTSESEFWWQRHFQYGAGLQWYPFDTDPKNSALADSFRLYGIALWRSYYDKNGDTEDFDVQAGFDFYRDNFADVFNPQESNWLAWSVYTNFGYRHTNFSLPDYNGLVWNGSADLGPRLRILDRTTCIIPYVTTQWSWSPQHEERWFENYVRFGAGIRVFPFAKALWEKTLGRQRNDPMSAWTQDLLGRLNIYGEFLYEPIELGQSRPSSVEETEVRIGISFATGGFFRD